MLGKLRRRSLSIFWPMEGFVSPAAYCRMWLHVTVIMLIIPKRGNLPDLELAISESLANEPVFLLNLPDAREKEREDFFTRDVFRK